MEHSALIADYYKNPVNNYVMEAFDVDEVLGNSVCGDDIHVYLRVSDGVIVAYSFSWNPSMITSAAASLLADIIEWVSLGEVLTRNYNTLKEYWFEVSERRKRGAVSSLLAVRNALHRYMEDGKIDEYEDLF